MDATMLQLSPLEPPTSIYEECNDELVFHLEEILLVIDGRGARSFTPAPLQIGGPARFTPALSHGGWPAAQRAIRHAEQAASRVSYDPSPCVLFTLHFTTASHGY